MTKNGLSNQIRAWGHGYAKYDDFLGSIYDEKLIFFSVNPKHYKYNISCSGGGDGEDGGDGASCTLDEYTEPAEDDEDSVHDNERSMGVTLFGCVAKDWFYLHTQTSQLKNQPEPL